MKRLLLILAAASVLFSCSETPKQEDAPRAFVLSITVDGKAVSENGLLGDVSLNPEIVLTFSREIKLDKVSVASLSFSGPSLNASIDDQDKAKLVLVPSEALSASTKYRFAISAGVSFGVDLIEGFAFSFTTSYDSDDKFPKITDDDLFEKVQKAAFSYFWDYAHPASGLARERLGSGDTVTSGGSGFGIMCIPVGIERGWITRTEGAARMLKIVNFLTASERFHGAWPHWINGQTGKAIAFSTYDDGADLVETAFLIEGLLAARQYFSGSDATETSLRSKITELWESVEWTWFQQNGQNVLYWHWSPNHDWRMNMRITSWNEAQIVYILAASSPTYPISKDVYVQGWKPSNAYGYMSPLFFVHYSYMGLDPRKLNDGTIDYWQQLSKHVRTNYEYCVNSTKGYGYSAECWGLTASDYYDGYTASSPNHDTGTVAPTAALASFPYSPEESMAAMKYFYYKLGDRLWGEYGFKDAFALKENWFASSYIAIDEGPIVVMMENYRTGLLWDTFMKDEDVQAGLTKLGFTWK